ncbi:hypothetical protein [Cerasicoccus maritimus]|uniref:hypothetical protein n=1 Tax=Cerasicoccus maritimus TaxID=490089 RepID=UPI002852CF07|nr:hypothetical protein [Cerasicoccus maritimus]
MRNLRNIGIGVMILGSLWQTGCQSAENSQAQASVAEAQLVLPDFSPERAASEADAFNSYKSKPDFTQLDVVAIVPADEN